MIRVFLADDHALMREGVRRLLLETGEFTVVGEAGDGETMLVRAAQPDFAADVLVLDVSLPGISGFTVLDRVLALRPSLRVLVLSMHDEALFADRVLRAGASGYLSKSSPSATLVAALRAVHAGRIYAAGVESLPRRDASEKPPKHAALSPRELEVLLMVGRGASPSEIGHALALRPSTVSTHLHHIKTKLRVRTLADLVQYTLAEGLVAKPG